MKNLRQGDVFRSFPKTAKCGGGRSESRSLSAVTTLPSISLHSHLGGAPLPYRDITTGVLEGGAM